MPDANLEITQKAMEDFKKIQEYLKSFLNIAGVNLTELDKIKE